MATTHLLTGSTPVIRQTPLPWRLPNYITASPRFSLNFRPLISTAHSANPFKHALRCSAKPPLNPKSQPEDLDPLHLVGGFIGTILDAVQEMTIPNGDPNLFSVDHFVDTVLDAAEDLKTPQSKRKLESDTRCRDSDPDRADGPVDKEVISPQQSDPKPDPDHIQVKDIEDAILNAVEEMKKLPSIQVDYVIDAIRKAVEERKNPPSDPKPKTATKSKCSDPDRAADSVAESVNELKNLPSSLKPDPNSKPKTDTKSKCSDPDRADDSVAESVNEPKNPPLNPKPDPEVEDIVDTILGELEDLKNRIPVWVDDVLGTVMEVVEELKNPPSNPKPKADTQSEYSDAIRVNDIVDAILSAVKELKISPSNMKSGWVDDILDTIMNSLKDSQPKDLYQILAEPIMTNIIRNAFKDPAIAVALMGWLLMSDQFSNSAASVGRMGGSSCSWRRSSYKSCSSGSGQDLSWEDIAGIIAFLCFLVAADIMAFEMAGRKKTTVVKLQVGLSGSARSLQRDLNKIAETANASTPEGRSYILTESAVALLRHSDYYISASSFVDVETSVEKGEKLLNKFFIEERGKFDEETLVNVNNLRRKRRANLKSEGKSSNEYIVTTILVAAEGEHKLPTINGSVKDLKDAFQKLASIPSSRIAAVEVMWTPQEENDTLSEKELVEDYPHLKPIS